MHPHVSAYRLRGLRSCCVNKHAEVSSQRRASQAACLCRPQTQRLNKAASKGHSVFRWNSIADDQAVFSTCEPKIKASAASGI